MKSHLSSLVVVLLFLAAVLGLADKRLPAAFSLMAVFWLIGSAMLTRRNRPFAALQLTPMQQQLLDMFNAAQNGELSKEEICRHLKTSFEGSMRLRPAEASVTA